MVDPNHWQPLALDSMVGQNGIPIPGKVQVYVGPQWGAVTPFAVDFPGILPAPPPHIEDGAPFKQAAVDVLQLAGELTPDGSPLIDISPASIGNNPLGNGTTARLFDESRHRAAAAPQMVKRGDFGRVLAESGPTARRPRRRLALEHDRELRERSHRRKADRRRRIGRERPRVGREDVPRPQRRDARRGGRMLGHEARLRLGPPDLDGPVHGRTRAVDGRRRAVVRAERAAARPGRNRGDHGAIERARRAARGARPVRRRDRRPVVAGRAGGRDDAVQRRALGAREGMGTVPAEDVRDACLSGSSRGTARSAPAAS